MSMERITKALEMARAQRGQPGAAATAHVDANATTATFRAPSLRTSPEALEHAHILPPEADGPRAAPYKLLRTQVLQRLDQLGANSLAILSPASGAGKTLTAINLAIAISAELGRTALLVDLDLRNPNVHRRLGLEPLVGVEECLRSGRPVQDVIVRIDGYERLAVMPACGPVSNSSELLTSERAARLMSELRGRYKNRIMIFDLPPVLQADDALAFSKLVQAGLVVVGEGRTERNELVRCIEMLRDLPIVGTVLNGSRERTAAHY
jgi:protein-tyrosine kinase